MKLSDVDAHMKNKATLSSMNAVAPPGPVFRILMQLVPYSNALPPALHPFPPSERVDICLHMSPNSIGVDELNHFSF